MALPAKVSFRKNNDNFFFKILFIHERHTQRGRDIDRGRSRLLTGNLMWDSIPGPGIMP